MLETTELNASYRQMCTHLHTHTEELYKISLSYCKNTNF